MSETEQEMEGGENLLVSLDDYLSNGIHVGLKYKSADMKPFIYKVRSDKLCVFDVQTIDNRLRDGAKFISHYKPEEILVVSNRVYGRRPILKFAQYTGCKAFEKRFVSGSLTNPQIKTYSEPKLLIVTDPVADRQAVREAKNAGITVLAVCDTNTRINDIDYIIPANNKGKNSLALIYWILAKEVLKKWGIEGFDATLEDFISTAEPQPYLLALQEKNRRNKNKK
ncbi:MAG TPA: 30S ribosomal protein S2 [Candidatus Altiarchaeales archaeon]|nr:30S ribosomal protein S2 [Candidatus Altiarchaeales archaeon]